MKIIKCSSDNSLLVSPSLKLIAAAAISCAALCASAEIYTLGGKDNENNVGSDSSPVSWRDTANWTPASIPESGDSIQWAPSKTGSHRHAYISLNGDYTVGSLEQNYRTLHLYKDPNTVAETVSLTFATQLGNTGYQQSHELTAGVKLVVSAGATYNCSPSDHTHSGMDIQSGAEADIYGSILSRVMKLDVNGGALVFAPASYAIHSYGRTETDHDEINIASGSASFPNGIAMTGTFTEPNQVNQSGGTATFGGDFTSQMAWTYTWSGGTLAITDDSTFGANVALVIPASASVSLDIASGKSFAAPGLSADSTASITVTGGGTFSIAPTTASIILQNGSLGIATSGTYDLSNVSVGSGAATITLTAFGATINSLPNALAGATFSADLSNVAVGTVILNSSDSSVLTKVKSDLDASAPADMSLVISGTTLSLEKDAGAANTISKTGGLLDGASWGGGSVPDAGSEVAIAGVGVVATYSGGDVPAWALIEVKDGATLRIGSAASGLPQIKLNKNATLEIADGASLTLSSSSDLAGVATASQVPVLSVVSGATLNVPGGMKFKNLDLRHFGTIAASSAGRLYFGYADANETAYFAMCSTNATISTINEGSYGDGTPCFVCPAANGLVRVYGTIELDGLTLTRVKTGSTSIYDAVMVGVNNPVSAPFGVLFNNFTMSYRGYADFGGAATVTFRNSKLTRPEWQAWSSQGRWNVNDSAKVIFDNTEHYYEYPDGNSVGWFSSVAGTEAFVLTNSTVMWSRPVGNGNSKLTVYDSYYDCAYDAYITNQMHQGEYLFLPDLFDGLGELNIPENSFCALRALDHVTWDANDNAPERRCKVYSELDISGAGDLIVTNGVSGRYFEVIMQSDKNTCTGNLKVDSPEGYDAKLYFADGANWEGTVVSGNVALTNLVDSAAACTNSFGTLDLAAGTELKIRVWKTGGVIVAHDGLNVGSYVNHGGKIVFVEMDEELKPGDSFILGTIDDDSSPAFAGRWLAKKENDSLKVKYSSGLTVIMR